MPYGQCNFHVLETRCACPAGKEAPGKLAPDSLCVLCQHKLTQHVSNSEHLPPSDGLPDDIYPRERTVRALVNLLTTNTVVQVRGTPGSGKSCLALSLYYHLRSNGKKVILFQDWPGEEPAGDFLASACIGHGLRTTNIRVQHEDVVFIVDEAQESYQDTEFWAGIIKFQIGRICLFCSSGSAISGLTYVDHVRTPIVIEEEYVDCSVLRSCWGRF